MDTRPESVKKTKREGGGGEGVGFEMKKKMSPGKPLFMYGRVERLNGCYM